MGRIRTCFLFAGLLAAWTVASAATLYVDGNLGADAVACGVVASPCRTIQFTLAKSLAGDTVRVMPGTYNECIGQRISMMNRSIVAEAFVLSGDPHATIIDGAGKCDGSPASGNVRSPVVRLGDLSSISGFTVRHGGDTGIQGYGSVVITNNVIRENQAAVRSFTTPGLGGGIQVYSTYLYPSSSPIRIEDNEVVANTAPVGGGGMFVIARSKATRPLRPITIQNNVVRQNTTTEGLSKGAGMALVSDFNRGGRTEFTVTRNTIEGNSNLVSTLAQPSYGGGIFAAVYGQSTPAGVNSFVIASNTIRNNQSGGRGGGVALYTQLDPGHQATLVLESNIIEGNTAIDNSGREGFGGGVWAATLGRGEGTIRVTRNEIADNSAHTQGGGVLAMVVPEVPGRQEVMVESNNVRENTADLGAGVSLFMEAYALPSTATATLSAVDNTIASNSAAGERYGAAGGLSVQALSTLTNATGLVVAVEHNRIVENTATSAGGGVVLQAEARGEVVGMRAVADMRIRFKNNLVHGNQAQDASLGDAAGGGGVVYLKALGTATAGVEADFNTIAGNISDTREGGLTIESETATDALGAEGWTTFAASDSIVSDNSGIGLGGPIPGEAGLFTAGGTGNLVVAVAYSDVFGNSGGDYATWLGDPTGSLGNISADPLFAAAGNGDYHLTLFSPAIDAADPAASRLVDLDGNPGVRYGRADMGVFEYQACRSSSDCDDGDACTSEECDSVAGCVHAAVSCNDDNPCTSDSCDPHDGCRHTAVDLGTVHCGIGACSRTVASCFDGVPQTCVPGEPTAEVCNGIDDDCDGFLNERLVRRPGHIEVLCAPVSEPPGKLRPRRIPVDAQPLRQAQPLVAP